MASGLAAAAHGGFTAVCAMPNTTPAADEPGVFARVRAAAAASGSPVELLLHGAVTVGRGGERLAALGELADAGAVGFSDDGSPVKSAVILRNALLYAGMLGIPLFEHAEDPVADGRRGGERGLRRHACSASRAGRWPPRSRPSSERSRSWRAVLPDAPGARLHLTHLSTAGALDAVRRAKAAGLPVTCDVTPHHLGFTDEWVAGARRWAWEALAEDGGRARPVGRRRARGASLRHGVQGQPAAPGAGRRRRRAGGARRRDGRRRRHRPRPAHPGGQGGRVRPGGQRDRRRSRRPSACSSPRSVRSG